MEHINVHLVCEDEILDLCEECGVGGRSSSPLSQPFKFTPTSNLGICLIPAHSLTNDVNKTIILCIS